METLIGRAPELKKLDGDLKQTKEGKTTLRLITGEPGIGKSTLAKLAHDRATNLGFTAAWGRCWEAGDAPAFWPWQHILYECARILTAERLRTILTAACPIGSLPESLRGGLIADDEEIHTDSQIATVHEGSRMRVFHAICRALKEACDCSPLLLVFDDLHAADASSILLLLYVAREFQNEPLFLLAAYRSSDAASNESLAPLIAKLNREGQELALTGLSESEALDLYTQIAGHNSPAENIITLARAAGGNPLFLTELARLNPSTNWRKTTEMPLVISDVLAQRTDLMSDSALLALRTASLIGREFSWRLLARATGVTPPQLELDLAAAITSQLVQPLERSASNSNDGVWHFSHDILREHINDNIQPDDRVLYHRNIALAMENLSIGGRDLTAMAARHYCQAVPLVEAEKAAERVLSVASRSLSSGAYEEVEELCQLTLLTLATQSTRHHLTEAKAMLIAANASLASGEFDNAKKHFREAFDIAVESKSGSLAVRAALGFGALNEVGRTGPNLVKRLEQGLTLLGDKRPELRSLALGRLSQVLNQSTRKKDAVNYAHQARQLSQSIHEPIIEAQVLLFTTHVLQTPDNLDERLRDTNRAIELAREADSARVEFLAHEARIRHALEAGNALLADASRATAGQIAGELKNRLPTWLWMTHNAAIYCIHGEFHQGEKLINAALEYGCEHSNHNAWLMYFTAIHEVYFSQNIIEKARPTVEEICKKAPAASAAHTGRLWIQAHCDENHAAFSAELDRYMQNDFAEIPQDAFWLASMGMLGETAAIIHYPTAAEAIYKRLLPYANQHAMIYHGAYRGSISRVLGLLAHCLGDFNATDQHFKNGIAAEQKLRAVAYECYARLDRAAALTDPKNDTMPNTDLQHIAERELQHVEAHLAKLDIPRARNQLESLKTNLVFPKETVATKNGIAGWKANLIKEGDYWSLLINGNAHRLKSTKGLSYLAILAHSPEKPFAAIELVQAMNNPREISASTELEPNTTFVSNLGNSGTTLDPQALAQYRQRLEVLRSELAEAERNNDLGMVSQLRSESDFLINHIQTTTDFGGNPRESTGHSERARSAVTKALRTTVRKIQKLEPDFGHCLHEALKTGHFCEFRPNPAVPIKLEISE